MTTDIVKVDPKEFGLDNKKVESIQKAFKPKIAEREGLEVIYKDLITREVNQELCIEAGDLRKKLVKVRTGIAEIHKTQKAFFLASGRFVDAWKNKETLPVTQMEEKLSDIEKHYENIEKEKRLKLQEERKLSLEKYEVEFIPGNLGELELPVWENYLSGVKLAYENKKEAEKKAEEERIAKEKVEAKERERIQKENEQLKKEAEERERIAKIEADKRAKQEKERKAKEEAERKKREEKERKEREAYETKLKSEREERERVQREEKAKREKLEAELKAKEEAERKKREEEEAKVQAELSKGDADKLKSLIADLVELKTKYSFKSKKHKLLFGAVCQLIDKVVNYITEKK